MAFPMPSADVLSPLRLGQVIPAQPLALTKERKLDDRRQRALTRYYLAAGAGGIAVGTYTGQYEVHQEKLGLFRPLLELTMAEIRRFEQAEDTRILRVVGVCGDTAQAAGEAQLAAQVGYDLALISLEAIADRSEEQILQHCQAVAQNLPLMGAYLRRQRTGRDLSLDFWRKFLTIPNLVALRLAPLGRYQTTDLIRLVAEAGRAMEPRDAQVIDMPTRIIKADVEAPDSDAGIALYTGNDDSLVTDLLGNWTFRCGGRAVTQQIVGGLLGHWACWTHRAVELLEFCHQLNSSGALPEKVLTLSRQVTDMNAAIYDAGNNFAGRIPGVLEVLRRQGLLEGAWCLDPKAQLSPGQDQAIDRVCAAYPHLVDDDFVRQHREHWLS